MGELGLGEGSILPKRHTQDWSPGLLAPMLGCAHRGAIRSTGSEAKGMLGAGCPSPAQKVPLS